MNLVPMNQTWMPRRYSADDCMRIRHTFCAECSDAETDQFIATCERTGLDPWARQIYPRLQWDSSKGCKVMQVGITIDGQRLIAARTGQYGGQTEPQWCGKDGKWREIWPEDEAPVACRCAVYREGFVQPMMGIALYRDYAAKKRDGGITQMWRDRGPHMLWKCAEALALRKAFPQELSGLYTDDEMMQAETEQPQPAPRRQEPARVAQQTRQIEHQPHQQSAASQAPFVPGNIPKSTPQQNVATAPDGTKHDAQTGEVIEEQEADHPDVIMAKQRETFLTGWKAIIRTATNWDDLRQRWNKDGKKGCIDFDCTQTEHDEIQKLVIEKGNELKAQAAAQAPAEVPA